MRVYSCGTCGQMARIVVLPEYRQSSPFTALTGTVTGIEEDEDGTEKEGGEFVEEDGQWGDEGKISR